MMVTRLVPPCRSGVTTASAAAIDFIIMGRGGMKPLSADTVASSTLNPVPLKPLATCSALRRNSSMAVWIRVSSAFARAAEGPFGTTIAHGFLTLSLCVPMLYAVMPASGAMVVNYGVDRVRFPAAVRSGARIRGRFRVASVEDGLQGQRAVIEATIECEGVDKPVCVAQLVVLAVP